MTDQQYKTRWINAWKRRNKRKTRGTYGKMAYAYNVPGSREHGSLSMWLAQPPSSFKPEKNPSRRRNVAGFVDDAGEFHPIRGSAGYDRVRAGDNYSRSVIKKKAKKRGAKRRNGVVKMKRNRLGQFVKKR
jgi:hypothetical protein